MKAIELALLDLKRRKLQTTIVLLAIVMAVASGGVLLRLYLLSGRRFLPAPPTVDAVVGAKAGGLEILMGSLNGEGPFPDFIPYGLYESLKAGQIKAFEDGSVVNPNFIRHIFPLAYFGKFGRFRVVGTDDGFWRDGGPAAGALQSGRDPAAATDALVGCEVARAKGLHVGDTIAVLPWVSDRPDVQESLDATPLTLTVSGILRKTGAVWDFLVVGQVAMAQATYRKAIDSGALHTPWKDLDIHYMLVTLPPGAAPSLENLVNRRTVAQVVEVKDTLGLLAALTGNARLLGLAIMLLIVFLGALCITAMMTTRFEAMSQQMAILRAIGYRRLEIAFWLGWEGLIVGGAACLPGAGLDALIFAWVRRLLGTALASPERVPSALWQSWPVWLCTLFGCLLAAVVPLLKLRREDVHSLLRGI